MKGITFLGIVIAFLLASGAIAVLLATGAAELVWP